MFSDPALVGYILPTDDRVFGYYDGQYSQNLTYRISDYKENWSVKMPSVTPSFLGRFAASLGMTPGLEGFNVSKQCAFHKISLH